MAWALVVVAVMLGAAAVRGARVRSGEPVRADPSRSAALDRLARLPVQGQGVISTALGAGDARFAARRTRFGYRLAGGGVIANLRRRGVGLMGDGGSVGLSLTSVGRGGHTVGIGPATPVVHRNRVVLVRGAVTEWYAAGPLGIEQGFTVARHPVGDRGALMLGLSVHGTLVGHHSGSGIAFASRSGRVVLRYGGLAATDASGRVLRASMLLDRGRLLVRVIDRGARYPVRIDPFVQQGAKIVGSCTFPCGGPNGIGEVGQGAFGWSVALSADGSTALIGGPQDNTMSGAGVGAAWVFTRSRGTWSQQGSKLTGGGEVGQATFGWSVALSADGNTALIGGPGDNGIAGAAWVFTRSAGVWTQQGPKLTGAGETGAGEFGWSTALSADGNTALIGGVIDNGAAGAAWAFTRSSGVWSQQGPKLTGAGETGAGLFGFSAALSADGNTALIGGDGDHGSVGAAWVFTRSAGLWSQQGPKLTGAGESGSGSFGRSVTLSGDGNTALIGGLSDSSGVGAAWVFARAGTSWSQQGAKLTGAGNSNAGFGWSVALSSNGNTALVGGAADHGNFGAAWAFTRSGATWSQQGPKLVGDCTGACGGASGSGESGEGSFGAAVALSADGTTALIGGPDDSSSVGAAWVFTQPATCADVGASTPPGGGAASVSLQCSAPPGASLAYAIASPPAHGALGPIDQSTGQVTYISLPGYVGTDSFTYFASDTVGAANVATATITIPPLPPTCTNVVARTPPGGGAARVSLSCRGPTGAPLTYAIVSPPSHGSLSAIDQSGSVVYVSRLGFHGTDRFAYRASDSGGSSNTATSTITVPRPIGTLAFALLGASFNARRTYSKVSSMTATDLPIGSKIIVSCTPRRCRFKAHTVKVTRAGCKHKRAHCRRKHGALTRSVDLTTVVRGSRFPVGATLAVSYVKSGFVGKVFLFHIRSNKLPTLRATCLAPGSLVPGRGC